jgi:hypothetical protein
VTQDVSDFLCVQHEIDGDEHGTDSRHREPDCREGVRIARKNGDPITHTDALRCETGGELAAKTIKLRVSPDDGAATDRHLVRTPGRGAPQ